MLKGGQDQAVDDRPVAVSGGRGEVDSPVLYLRVPLAEGDSRQSGSTHSPRSLSVAVFARKASASLLRAKLRARSRPSGPGTEPANYQWWSYEHVPSGLLLSELRLDPVEAVTRTYLDCVTSSCSSIQRWMSDHR